MNPESICVSLELAKKLKEAEWKKDCIYCWYMNHAGYFLMSRREDKTIEEQFGFFWEDNKYWLAPTAEEILRELPSFLEKKTISGGKQLAHLQCRLSYLGEDGWIVNYKNNKRASVHKVQADTLVNAAAAMYCYLAENNLLPSQFINHDNNV